MTVALFGRDSGGLNTFAPQLSTVAFQVILTAGVAVSLTVPKSTDTNTRDILCVISPSSAQEVWVSGSGTATLPLTGSFVACDCEMNPPARMVKQGSTLSFISPFDINLGVSFFAPQGPY